MKTLFTTVHSNLKKHGRLAYFAKIMLIGLFVSVGLYAVQQNTRAQTILPLSTGMCAIYNAFESENRPYAAMQSDMYINQGTYNIDQLPYLSYFSALANYNMRNTTHSLDHLNMLLAMQGLPHADTVNDAAATLDPIITDGILIGMSPINGFTYYQGIYSVCSDTVDIPSDTSNTTYLEDAFILKNYTAGDETLLGTADADTYVGTKKIRTEDSDGEIIQPFVMQSSGTADTIEIHAPEDLVVYSGPGSTPFLGVIENPVMLNNSEASELSNVRAVMELPNDQNAPLFFKDTLDDTAYVQLVIPVIGGNVGERVEIYSSQDGTNRSLDSEANTILIDGDPYVIVETSHATIFAIVGGSTGSFVINNDGVSTSSPNVNLDIYAPSAQYMRFQNDGTGGARSAREAYATDKAWTLSVGFGSKTVYAQFDIDGNTGTIEAETSDDINYVSGPVGCGPLGNGEACITLEVIPGGFSCSLYPTAIDFGTTTGSNSDTLLTSDEWTDSFACTDFLGVRSTPMTAQSSDLTGDSIGLISASNITWMPTAALIQTAGDYSDLALGAGGTLDNPIELITKSGNHVSDFTWTPADEMTVNIPAYTPVESYTAVMIITDPN